METHQVSFKAHHYIKLARPKRGMPQTPLPVEGSHGKALVGDCSL